MAATASTGPGQSQDLKLYSCLHATETQILEPSTTTPKSVHHRNLPWKQRRDLSLGTPTWVMDIANALPIMPQHVPQGVALNYIFRYLLHYNNVSLMKSIFLFI